MRRRAVIAAALGAVALRPFIVLGEQQKRLIGFLGQGSQAAQASFFGAFSETLVGLGWGPDKLAVETRWADGYTGRLPGLAAELVRLLPDILVASTIPVAQALLEQTTTIPIVFATGDAPVEIGLVASLARPGGPAAM
jgi:putative tryptophan/tyrosine transport system substrate-binding protein